MTRRPLPSRGSRLGGYIGAAIVTLGGAAAIVVMALALVVWATP